jgi:hypothetical protein
MGLDPGQKASIFSEAESRFQVQQQSSQPKTPYYGKDDQPDRFYQATFVIIGPWH